MRTIEAVVASVLISMAFVAKASSELGVRWQTLQPGVDYAAVMSPSGRDLSIDGRIHLVRIDPPRVQLEALMAGAVDGHARTAAQWCRDRNLAVAINMGMYREDKRTNSGYARAPGYVNNPKWAAKYKTALGFGSIRRDVPAVLLADLDNAEEKERLAAYGTVIQNLRLIRAPGQSVWSKQERRWSEAAVGVDKQGRLLLIFSRYPYSMKEFTAMLLALPIGIVSAMHVEGGPEASLSIHGGGVDLDLNGSYETGFNENDGELQQWPIPNVIGIRRR